ncbi:MAG: response regulator [Halobacteriales archaeon]|nr:response regulator [Halobacteriales archaeon]
MKPTPPTLHVLQIDDNPDDIAIVQKAFEAAGPVRFTSLGDSTQLLPRLRGKGPRMERPHVILLDLGMAKMSANEVLVALKKDSKLRSIPVVILSGRDVEPDGLLNGEAGAHAFVAKSDDYAQLKTKVASIYQYLSRTVLLPEHDG